MDADRPVAVMTGRAGGGASLGLCMAGAVSFAVGVAFVAFWGFQVFDDWTMANRIVAGASLLGCLLLGLVPVFATRAGDPATGAARVGAARWVFAAGILLVWAALAAAVLFTPVDRDEDHLIREARFGGRAAGAR